jgi:hypothetical protein
MIDLSDRFGQEATLSYKEERVSVEIHGRLVRVHQRIGQWNRCRHEGTQVLDTLNATFGNMDCSWSTSQPRPTTRQRTELVLTDTEPHSRP